MFFTGALRIALLAMPLLTPILSAPSSDVEADVVNEELQIEIIEELLESAMLATPRNQLQPDKPVLEAHRKFSQIILKTAGGSLESQYLDTIQDFLFEKVPLESTRSALVGVLTSVGDDELRHEFSDFLDAPLNTEDDDVAARASLCRILEIASTFSPNHNIEEISADLQFITAEIHRRWKDHPKKVKTLILKFYSIATAKSDSEAFSITRELTDMIWDQEDLVMRVEKYYERGISTKKSPPHNEL